MNRLMVRCGYLEVHVWRSRFVEQRKLPNCIFGGTNLGANPRGYISEMCYSG